MENYTVKGNATVLLIFEFPRGVENRPRAGISVLPSPAKDFGWHDPGYIHSAIMTGLQPSQSYTYRYGR